MKPGQTIIFYVFAAVSGILFISGLAVLTTDGRARA